MGNSASVKKEHDFSALPENLFDLEDAHFKCLWNHAPLTSAQITQAGRSFPKSPRNAVSGLYQGEEEESPEAALAVRLCQLLPDLAAIRFKLVPSKLKESRFWQAVLILLKERLVDYNYKQYHGEDDTEEFIEENDDTANEEEMKQMNGHINGDDIPKMNGNHTPKPIDTSASDKDLARQLKAKNAQIAKLKKQVKELQEALEESSSNNSQQPNPKHKGSWKMSKDSQEFLEYPDEVKDNLRKEKQRRLQQVKDEMKFILDSDATEHSHGKWSCCGQAKYHAHCSM